MQCPAVITVVESSSVPPQKDQPSSVWMETMKRKSLGATLSVLPVLKMGSAAAMQRVGAATRAVTMDLMCMMNERQCDGRWFEKKEGMQLLIADDGKDEKIELKGFYPITE